MVAMTVSVKGKGIKKHPENLRNIFGAVQPSPPNIKALRIIFVNVQENFKVCRIKKNRRKSESSEIFVKFSEILRCRTIILNKKN